MTFAAILLGLRLGKAHFVTVLLVAGLLWSVWYVWKRARSGSLFVRKAGGEALIARIRHVQERLKRETEKITRAQCDLEELGNHSGEDTGTSVRRSQLLDDLTRNQSELKTVATFLEQKRSALEKAMQTYRATASSGVSSHSSRQFRQEIEVLEREIGKFLHLLGEEDGRDFEIEKIRKLIKFINKSSV